MCGVKLKDRFPSKELRERLGMDDTLRWYGHVLRKEDDDWMKNNSIASCQHTTTTTTTV